jgi:shikimate kinase
VNITLIGYRGTGKTTVARLVAEELGWDWFDLDACIEERARRTIREVFASEGEPGFRDRESELIRELAGGDRLVIAAGGGTVLRPANRSVIKASGFTVWLVASPSTIHHRIESDPSTASRRPSLTDHDQFTEICRLLSDREPLYRECADLIVQTDHVEPVEIARRIVDSFAARQASKRTE